MISQILSFQEELFKQVLNHVAIQSMQGTTLKTTT